MKRNHDPLDPRSMEIHLLDGCAQRASVFLSVEGVPFALIPGKTSEQSDLALLHSPQFASYVREAYHAQQGYYPKEALIRLVCDLLDRRASHRGVGSPPVGLRVAGGLAEQSAESGQPLVLRQVLALDLGRRSPDEPDSVLEVDAHGWSVSQSSGFAFIRSRGHRPLPLPQPAGPEALTELKDLLRVDEDDWLRLQSWLLAAMRPTGPYPILVLQGEARNGKSQAAKMLKSLLDPTAVAFQPLPANSNTLLRQAAQTWIQTFDHVTGMPKQISAALCRLSTSAGFNLLIDGSPLTISLARPILITVPTGASGATWKPTDDLLHRMLTVTLPPLTAAATRPEAKIAERFLQLRPKLLGALAQAASVAMGGVDQIQLASYPRHADAAVFAIAAAPALNATEESLQQALAQTSQFQMAKDPLLQKLATLMASREHWQGTATELKLELDVANAPNHLSRQIKEVQAILGDQGIEIVFPRRQENGQLIRITKVNSVKEGCASPSAAAFPVSLVDCTSKSTPTSVPAKIDHQIVSAEENKGETITLPQAADRQVLRPAASVIAAPAESPEVEVSAVEFTNSKE